MMVASSYCGATAPAEMNIPHDVGSASNTLARVIRDDWYENKGMSKIHAAHIIRKIESIIDDLKNEAELAFSKYCDEELFCAWQAFNGEAGYSKTGKRLWQEVEELNKKTA